MAFYGAIGFEFECEPANADTNPPLRALFGLPDARIRRQFGRSPIIEGGVEIVRRALRLKNRRDAFRRRAENRFTAAAATSAC